MLVRDAKAAEAELSRLKQLNVLLALDDFGTGFSFRRHHPAGKRFGQGRR
jgi:EAL domain-containing protein (putative c-di-GMP-specific phosphodiesterase class I)